MHPTQNLDMPTYLATRVKSLSMQNGIGYMTIKKDDESYM